MIVYVGIPVIDGKPYAALVDSLLAEQLLGYRRGVHFLVDWEIGCSLIGHARNKLAHRFLSTPEASCLVFVDADISWKAGDLTRLAEHSEPVIGATYRMKSETIRFHVRGPVERCENGLFDVEGLPGGFLKIDRSVFQSIPAQPYESAGVKLHDYFPTGVWDGTFWGEDYGFCSLYRAHKGRIRLDPSIRLKHHDGARNYSGDPVEWLEKAAQAQGEPS